MKKILLLFCTGFSLVAVAQKKEGKVVYERTIQMQNRFAGMNEEIVRQIPRSRTDNFELLFGNNQSLWQYLPNAAAEESNTFTGGGGMVMMRFAGNDDIVYHNFETGKRIEQRELGDNNYIIEDSIRKLKWKLSEETKTILGHTARKATAQRIETRPRVSMENGEIKRRMVTDTSPVVAWFTSDIPVPAGPEFGGQLPGLILELDINNGRIVYKAVEIAPKVKLSDVKAPSKGKKVTNEEFAEERDKMFEEMRRNLPAGREIRITGN